ncbi:hypothetical protein [uncultured Flavobacterium sp.]|uniref:hypothetical protein n=1 Tax=uncultured Flavobacterium sp. TaxID=165435 RepID=UPI0029319B13|nr:hypothetical protein [uncultured Flavobacterium sp.]
MKQEYYGLTIDQYINIVIAASTLLTLICTFFIIRESVRMRKMYITPDISMYLHFGEASPTLMFLTVENIGFGTACNVKFKIIKDYNFYKYKDDKLINHGIFNKGISDFYPKQKFRYFINDLSENNLEKIKENFLIQVSYHDVTNKSYKKTYDLKIEEFIGGSKFTPPESYIGRISYELEQIKKIYSKDLDSKSEQQN